MPETRIKLFDLAGAEDDRRTSPVCWRIGLALAHKGLAYQSVSWRRVEKEAISFSKQGLVDTHAYDLQLRQKTQALLYTQSYVTITAGSCLGGRTEHSLRLKQNC